MSWGSVRYCMYVNVIQGSAGSQSLPMTNEGQDGKMTFTAFTGLAENTADRLA